MGHSPVCTQGGHFEPTRFEVDMSLYQACGCRIKENTLPTWSGHQIDTVLDPIKKTKHVMSQKASQPDDARSARHALETRLGFPCKRTHVFWCHVSYHQNLFNFVSLTFSGLCGHSQHYISRAQPRHLEKYDRVFLHAILL